MSGVGMKKLVMISIKHLSNHPFAAALFLFLLFLYRSSPFLFSLLLSASPVLVCTALLLGTLLSFGPSHHHQHPLLDHKHHVHLSRELNFQKQWILHNKQTQNIQIQDILNLGHQTRDGIALSDEQPLQSRVSTHETPHFQDFMSLESNNRFDQVLTSSLNVQHDNFEDFISAQGSVDAHVMDHLEPSLASWKQFDEVDDGLSPTQHVQDDRFQDYQLAQESSDAQMQVQLESSLRSWEQLASDRDEDEESDYGSDGAESSSPDASMADIIPMLHELDPLLEDDIPLVSDLSRQNSAAKSPNSSIHSDDESDQNKEQGEDCKSEADDDNEDETIGGAEDPAKSAIMWTEDDQKNLMDLGTSELERNQRLESLIARRRARKMTADRKLMDLDGMDLTFPVAPISTRKHNPFDFPHDSYDDLGLPPIPGSAPSVMLARRNPFDLPYDSSEEKPDLTGDSFQQEFMELTQREAYTQREAIFRRNETFNLGSSAFDIGRPSRFRPYFIPERSDSDVMSYCSLQRQFSELSESKASSAGETDMTSVGPDQEEKKPTERNSSEVAEPTSEIDHASLLVEHGSQSSDDLDSLLRDDKQKTDSVPSVPEVEWGGESLQFENSHGVIQLGTTLIEVKHNISSSVVSVPRELHEVEDVSSSLVNKEQSQINDTLSIEIAEKCSLESLVSDITDQSLGALDNNLTTVGDNDHLKEPIYDLSPLKKDPSLSSSSSDIQRETSGIDIYHLSRDLFVVEETYVHNKHSENVFRDPEQDTDENCLKPNDISEGSGLDNTDSELNQVLRKSQTSVVAEDEGHLCTDSSERGVEEKLSDNNLSPSVFDKVFIQGDNADIYHENSLDDDSSSDDTISSGGLEFLEESVLLQDEIEGDALADKALPGHSTLSCSTAELTEDMGMKSELNQRSEVSSLESHKVDVTENPSFSLDENHFLSHDSNVDDNSADLEQELSMIHRELEEVGLVNKVDEPVSVFKAQEPPLDNLSDSLQTTVSSQPEESSMNPVAELAVEDHTQIDKLDDSVNVFKVQEPQLDNLSDSLQTTVYSTQPEESATNPVVELAVEAHTQEMPETRDAYILEEDSKISDNIKGSISDELVIHEKRSDVKELDETLLSELDAVGDFSAINMVPNLNSDIPAGVLAEVYSTTDSHTGANMLETRESNLDSHAGDGSAGFLSFETHSVEDIEAAFNRVRVVQNSVASESSHAEFTGKDVEVSIPERKSMSEDTVQERNASEDTEPGRIQPDLAFSEVQNLDSNRGLFDFGMPGMDAMLFEQSGEDVEKVTEESYKSDNVEALQTVPETEIGCVEFMPSVDRDKEIDESPLVEEISSLAVEPRDETVSVGSIGFASSQIDKDIEGIQVSVSVDSSNSLALESEDAEELKQKLFVEEISSLAVEPRDETKSVDPIVFASSQMHRDIEGVHECVLVDSNNPLALECEYGEDRLEIPVHGASIENVAKSENQSERNTTQPPLDEAKEVTQESAFVSEVHQRVIVESSEPLELDINMCEVPESPAFEASVPSAQEFEEEKKVVQSLESESLTLDEVAGKIQDSFLTGASIVSSLDFKQEEVVRSSESEPLLMHGESEKIEDPNALQESLQSTLESEDEKEVVGSLKSEEEKEVTGSLLDYESEKIEVSPLVRHSIALSLEFEEEKGVVETLKSELLQKDTVIEELREWHVIDESSSLAVESGDQIERSNPIEAHPVQEDANFVQIQDSSTVATAVASVSYSGDKNMICNFGETGLVIDRDIGKLSDLTGVSEKRTPAIEPEGQLERFYSVGFEFLQMIGDSKEMEESPNLQTSCASVVEDDETEMNSQMEDHQLVSQQQSEVGVARVGSDIHSDSSSIVARLSNNEIVQGDNMAESVNNSSQVETSHLVFTSSSSSSSSSDSDEN